MFKFEKKKFLFNNLFYLIIKMCITLTTINANTFFEKNNLSEIEIFANLFGKQITEHFEIFSN